MPHNCQELFDASLAAIPHGRVARDYKLLLDGALELPALADAIEPDHEIAPGDAPPGAPLALQDAQEGEADHAEEFPADDAGAAAAPVDVAPGPSDDEILDDVRATMRRGCLSLLGKLR